MLYQSHEPSSHPSLQRSFTREQSNSGLPIRRLTLLCILHSHCDNACCDSVSGGVNFNLKKGKISHTMGEMQTYQWQPEVHDTTIFTVAMVKWTLTVHHTMHIFMNCTCLFTINLITTYTVINYQITQILLHQMTSLICGTFVTITWREWENH
jgi:hypothetical protein